MSMEQALIKLGLSDKEAKVYLALLELSKDSVQNLAKKAKVNRATTYVILEHLMALGLASRVEVDKKTYFIAESPSELANLLEEQKREIENKRHHLDEVMDQLAAIYNVKKDKPTVRFFEGADGLEALDRVGRDGKPQYKEMLTISPYDMLEELFPSRRKESLSERVKLGIRSRVIYTRKSGPIDESVHKEQLRDARFVPREKLPISATISIYPNWGVKIYYLDKYNPYGILIQSPDIAENFKYLFELAWTGARDCAIT